MKKNKFISRLCLIILTLSFCVCCTNNKKQVEYFDKIENKQELQSVTLFSLKSDSISTVKYNILQSFYNEQKKSFSYKTFKNLLENLDNLSNKEKQLLYFTKNYKLDKNIQNLENLPFNEKIKKLQLESNSKNGYFISPSKYKKEELYSILYLFYKDHNYILFDDDIGQYLILDFNKIK
jgi:hypothetical protein